MKNRLETENIKVISAYAAVCIIWGSTYLAMRVAVGEFPPELFAGLRFLTAGVIVLIYALIKGYEFPNSISDFSKSAFVGVMLLTGGNGLVMWSEQWVHSGMTALILASTPLFTAVIEVFILRENTLGWLGWTGLLGGFSGVALLVFTGSGVGSIDLKGGLLLIIASSLWAIGSLYFKKSNPSGSNFAHIGIQNIAGGLLLCILGLVMGEASLVKFNIKILEAFGYLVIFGSIIGYSANMYVLKKWPASRAITSAYINPVVAVYLGAIFLSEPVNFYTFISMGIILGGVITVQIAKNSKAKIC